MTKETGILFKPEMIEAILNGTKTMTRRVVKSDELLNDGFVLDFEYGNTSVKCPVGKVGDLLYVKETFCKHPIREEYCYKANLLRQGWFIDFRNKCKWKSPLFMPKKAARIWLEIISIRVEKLQDISKEDSLKEGIYRIKNYNDSFNYKDYLNKSPFALMNPIHSFRSLWESINGNDWNKGWNVNPFVWVIEFKQVDRPNN